MQTVYSFLQNNALYLIVGGTNGGWAHMRTMQTVRGFLQFMIKFEFVPHSMLRKVRGKLANGVGLPCNYDLYHIVCHQTEIQSTREPCKRHEASVNFSLYLIHYVVKCTLETCKRCGASQLTPQLEEEARFARRVCLP